MTIIDFFSRFKRTLYRTLDPTTIDTRHGQATACLIKQTGEQIELIMLIE